VIRSIAANGRPDLGGVFRPIDRPRVLDRLATAAQYRIATIIAPAGFGKSVAVRQYLATVGSSVVYDVPPDAATLLPFVRGFADALEGVVPALRRSLATALDGARSSEAPGRDLAAWVATHVRSLDALIVIDDLHNGEGDPEISRFVTALVDRTKDGPRWLFSSRSPLQLPVASWLAYGESDLVVDAVDLRFSIDEAKQSARATRVAVRDEELEQILGLIDGWPAALTFALRTSTRASDLRAVSAGTREMVYRYLAEQVWHSLDERIRGFLRTAAFLPRLETRLAVAAGFDDAAAIIESLRERVAFISVLDAGVYKLHDLFRDFVQRQIALEGDEALRAAQITAGSVLETVGIPEAALQRYIEARATDHIVRVISTYNFSLLESGHYDTVERAIRALPSGKVLQIPGVLAVRAALEDAHGRVDQAEKWYASVLQQIGTEDSAFATAVAWRYGLMLFQQGRLDALPVLEEFRAREDLNPSDRAQILGTLATIYALANDQAKASATLAEALELAEFAEDEVRTRTYGRAATVAFYAGDEAAVEQYTREATRLAIEGGSFGLAARLFSALASQHWFAGRIPVAAWYATQVASNAEKAGYPQMRAVGLRLLMDIEAERGNAARIVELEHELGQLSYRGPSGIVGWLVGHAMSLAWRKQFVEAQSVLTNVNERDLTPYQQRLRYALLSVVAAAADNKRASTDALAAYDRAVERDVDPRAVFARSRALGEHLATLANILVGRNAVAQRMLRAVRGKREDLAAFSAVLGSLLIRDPEGAAAGMRDMRLAGQSGYASLVEVVSTSLFAPQAEAGENEALTSAETEVLRAISRGLSNQAIADEQGRTINTVRSHVSSVLRKLGVASRGEAVAAARRRELV
jgi:ATP/maltotriose-dependent transcriptional regulator MalT